MSDINEIRKILGDPNVKEENLKLVEGVLDEYQGPITEDTYAYIDKVYDKKSGGKITSKTPKSKKKVSLYVDEIEIGVMGVDDRTILPHYAHEGDAAMDVYIHSFKAVYSAMNVPRVLDPDVEKLVLLPGERVFVGLGYHLVFPAGYGAIVKLRSGIVWDFGLIADQGLIDNPYTGEHCITIYNPTKVPYTMEVGKRIAQIRLISQIKGNLKVIDSLPETSRGSAGFGSSGLDSIKS